MTLLWTLIAAAAATPAAADLEAAWNALAPQLEAHAEHPLTFSASEWKKVAAGEVARRRERIEGTDRVVGLIWVPAAPATTWAAVMDPHGSVVDGMVYEVLPGATPDVRDAYQSIQLPWPLAARQWVIRVENNLDLMSATDGRVWERTWKLSDRRDADHILPKAVWLPVNEGGWCYAEAAGGTLVAYHVRTVVGGIVPDEAAIRWSFGTLSGMLHDIRDRAEWVREHYDADHEPIIAPGGTPIPPLATPPG
jgi:hypothetical protein